MTVLDGQTAIIVGAAGGIGREVVLRYLAEGARVVAVDRNAERLADLSAAADGTADLVTLAVDASSWESSQAMVAAAVEAFGGVDVLVSCVGIWDQAVRLIDIPGERLGAAA